MNTWSQILNSNIICSKGESFVINDSEVYYRVAWISVGRGFAGSEKNPLDHVVYSQTKVAEGGLPPSPQLHKT